MNELSILNHQAIATLLVCSQDYWTIVKLMLNSECSGDRYLASFRA
ncbi:MAG: hypothetical protein QNJ74_00610 [Trichodesmium sp. MO_231.B1]|nr:hypothetical protein [Trichodesmium sp. MO_231.B1]